MSDQIQRLREVAEAATEGRWKSWGMSALADQGGASDVDTAVRVADTFSTDDAGRPRTYDLDWIIASQPQEILPLLDRLERAEAAVERVRAMYEAWMAWDGSLGPDGQTHPDASSPRDRDRLRKALDGGER